MRKLIIKTFEDFDNLNVDEMVKETLKKNKKKFIITVNPEIFIQAVENSSINEMLLSKNTINIPDSIAVERAIKKTCKKTISRYPGVDLLTKIIEEGDKLSKTIYLYGSKEEVNASMKEWIEIKYPNLKVIGRKNGYDFEESLVQKEIIKLNPDIVAVALGMPKQEQFLYNLQNKLTKGILIGVGGAFAAITGKVKRAPKIMIKLKLEWLYRLIREPKRIGRFFKYNIKFVLFKIEKEK